MNYRSISHEQLSRLGLVKFTSFSRVQQCESIRSSHPCHNNRDLFLVNLFAVLRTNKVLMISPGLEKSINEVLASRFFSSEPSLAAWLPVGLCVFYVLRHISGRPLCSSYTLYNSNASNESCMELSKMRRAFTLNPYSCPNTYTLIYTYISSARCELLPSDSQRPERRNGRHVYTAIIKLLLRWYIQVIRR
jgi:hypothetical protein